jgi:IS5 family transposase
MKRPATIEPTIGHMKSEHRLECNRLKGTAGSAINALLSAAAPNFGKLLGWGGRFGIFLRALVGTIFFRGYGITTANG